MNKVEKNVLKEMGFDKDEINKIDNDRKINILALSQSERKKLLYENKQWYTIRSLLGNTWARYYILIGARERGKSYSVQDYVLSQWFKNKKPFYWMRLNEAATKNMLMNNGAKMFEPLLVRKYNLQGIKVKGDTVFLGNEILCRVYALSTAYNNKGSALFDKKTFHGANIIVDEFQLEKKQKRTFDIVYNFKMQLENICRSEYEGVRVFLIGNNTEECSDILALFNFIPLEWGVYKLKSRHCIIDYIPNTKAYEERRKMALANDLDNGTGNFTNKIERDLKLIYKGRRMRPSYIIKFSKSPDDWYTVWDGSIIAKYNKEKCQSYAMKRYIDDFFNADMQKQIYEINDARAFKFVNLMVQTRFYYDLSLIKPQ